jgi:cellulose synthase/poly-beta-1,6-N-acetylglucosamine synthase-like glycosyltransferase
MTAQLVVLISVAYVLYVFVLSRRQRPDPPPAPNDLTFAFVIPCLNEEAVIGATLEALLPFLRDNDLVLVVDDASDDRTAEVVRALDSPRVHVLRRELPNARNGKGDALNTAVHYLRGSALLEGYAPDRVVVAVFDADGRLSPGALTAVAGYFRDPRAGAVQIGVQMRNARTNLLARLQDVELIVFTEVFQRARQLIGSVGLGGNGQFVRLTALESLGDAPWTDCLTEDLDLGVRLLLAGWRNTYCPSVWVDQQAVTTVRRWLRQRARWFQGHLQCWRLVPAILKSSLKARSASDLIWYLMLPVAVLLIPLAVLPLLLAVAALSLTNPHRVLNLAIADHGLLLLLVYLLSFGPSYPYAFVYWLRGRTGLLRAIALAHAFELYSHLWFIAGWMAVFRIARRKRGWEKTARVVEPQHVGVNG